MRILLNGSYAPSLIGFRGPLIRMLCDRGDEVHVSAPDIAGDVRAELERYGATVHEVPLSRTGTSVAGDIGYFLALRRLMRRIAPDFVLGYTIKPNIWGSLAARSLSIRSASMVTGLGYAFAEPAGAAGRLLSGLSRRLYRLATNANARVIFQNPDDLADFAAAGCLADPAKAGIVNGSGVDLAHYAPAPLPSDAVFLLIGRFLGAKGVREYAQAAASLLARHPEWRFQLVGFPDEGPDGIPAAELTAIEASGVEFLGRQDDVRPAIREASVFVLPSYREGTPRSVLEAMAMGRPIVTTDAPGCRETVTGGVNGRLVPVGDAEALASAMEELGSSRALRQAMGAESVRIAREKYAVEQVNTSLVRLLGI
ncbi:glycosyltransferase family 4 protein [Pelagerythrobacter sp.]|uniref:glycosyltransferase family 4 protein n=1 Tax=Pelagerythrobacter sp. TaxID=2800702 RepID=UPI0035B0D4CC